MSSTVRHDFNVVKTFNNLNDLIYWYFDRTSDTKNPSKRSAVKCKKCETQFTSQIAKMETLEAHIKNGCPAMSIEEIKQFVDSYGVTKKKTSQSSTPVTKVVSQSFSMNSFLDRGIGYSESHELDLLLLRWFATSGIPYLAAENPFFKQFISVLRPKYTPPGRIRLSDKLLKEEYEKVKDVILKEIEESEVNCMVADGWTDASTIWKRHGDTRAEGNGSNSGDIRLADKDVSASAVG